VDCLLFATKGELVVGYDETTGKIFDVEEC